MGGAINIESTNNRNITAKDEISPEKKIMTLDPELRPYTYISKNTFKRNLAYLSGGSIFIRSTRMGDDEKRYDELCGIINIEGNTFDGNLGATSQTTGGAVSLACDSMKHRVWKNFSNVPYGAFDE